jgi:ABC-type multidrug transport system fused ATPase/permease subunit
MVSKASNKHDIWMKKSANVLQESIMNIKTVQSCNAQPQMANKFSSLLDNGRIYGVFTYFWNGFFTGTFFLCLYIFYGLGLVYGAVEFYHGRVSGGDVLIISNAILIGSYLLGFISPHIMAILKARVAASIIYNTIERVI